MPQLSVYLSFPAPLPVKRKGGFSIERILNFHAQMPQLFAYLSFPASSPGKRKGGLMTQVIPASMKRMEMNSAKPQASFRNNLADKL
jgi:hypothetical protein